MAETSIILQPYDPELAALRDFLASIDVDMLEDEIAANMGGFGGARMGEAVLAVLGRAALEYVSRD